MTQRRPALGAMTVILAAALVACAVPEERRTDVYMRAFDTDGQPLPRARIRFHDEAGKLVGHGELHHGNGFRFESEQLVENGDWGRQVWAVDLDSGACISRDEPISLKEESRRIGVGGHPSLRSKKVTRYELRATLICLRPLSDERRRRYERALREGDIRSRIRAAVELGWIRAPAGASDELWKAMHDASAIALGLVHSPKPEALPALIAALDDDREPVRITAILLLARLGRNEHGVAVAALPTLEARMDDSSELVQVFARYAIARITPR